MTGAGATEALRRIEEIVGNDNFSIDDEELRYLSQDYFNSAKPVTAAIRPATIQSLAEAVAAATNAGIAIFQRGGGYSYSDSYLPTRWPSISIDMRGLDQITEINGHDMYVTVEAGCTWAKLDQSESVLGMEVVLADGSILVSGSAAQQQHSSFFRFYGPDITGLFCQDSGALGIKATITLRLQKRPALTDGLSFSCESFDRASEAMAIVAREGIVSENFGMSSALVAQAIGSRTRRDNLRTLSAVGRSGAGYRDGLMRMLRLVATGRAVSGDQAETIHFGLDATSRQIMKGQKHAVRSLVGRLGVETPNAIPIARRAEPFPDHPMLSPLGQRQLPFHAILPFSQAVPFHNALEAFLARHRPEMQRNNMGAVAVYTATSTNGFLYEPVFQWFDVPDIFHRRHTPGEIIEKADRNEPNPAARQLALELKNGVVDLMFEHGAVHLQIGKTYPYMKHRDPPQMRLLRELKQSVDPQNLVNPGALGLA
jgi:hypothetical protein